LNTIDIIQLVSAACAFVLGFWGLLLFLKWMVTSIDQHQPAWRTALIWLASGVWELMCLLAYFAIDWTLHAAVSTIFPGLTPALHTGITFVVAQNAVLGVVISALVFVATAVYVAETRRMRMLQERIAATQAADQAENTRTMRRIADALERLTPPPDEGNTPDEATH